MSSNYISSPFYIRVLMSATISTFKKRCSFRLYSQFLCRGLYFIYVVCIYYAYWCPMRFIYHTMFVSFNSNTTGAKSRTGTANPSVVRDAHSSNFCIVICRSLSFFCRPLQCLSCDLRLLITSLISSNFFDTHIP
jgi:hypothetical protein